MSVLASPHKSYRRVNPFCELRYGRLMPVFCSVAPHPNSSVRMISRAMRIASVKPLVPEELKIKLSAFVMPAASNTSRWFCVAVGRPLTFSPQALMRLNVHLNDRRFDSTFTEKPRDGSADGSITDEPRRDKPVPNHLRDYRQTFLALRAETIVMLQEVCPPSRSRERSASVSAPGTPRQDRTASQPRERT